VRTGRAENDQTVGLDGVGRGHRGVLAHFERHHRRNPHREGVKNRLAEFARGIIKDRNVAPNHGWRHRFKTVGMEAGIPTRVLDALQGHAPRTAAEGYGEVTIKVMAESIGRLPRVEV
jgi:hypothetical protein